MGGTNRQRRDAERRRLQRQLQRRAQRDARRRRLLAVVSVVGVLAVVAVVAVVIVLSGNEKTSGAGGRSSPGSTAASSPAGPYPCTWSKTSGTPARAVHVPTSTTPPRTGTATVSVTSNQGAMTFKLDRATAPCAVASFLSLAGQHYYDGTSCHRLTSGTLNVLQCGDPLGTGRGGPGYQFKDELSGREKYTRGVIAMANSGPDTNGAQFFIVYKDSQLAPSYTVLGTVSSGLGVVDKVAAAGSATAGDGRPKLPITLQKVTELQ